MVTNNGGAGTVPAKELFEKNYHEGKEQLTKLSQELTFITGVLASNGDSMGKGAGRGAASGTDEMTVSDLIEQLRAVVPKSTRSQSEPIASTSPTPTSRSQSDPIKRKAVCIITGLGKLKSYTRIAIKV